MTRSPNYQMLLNFQAVVKLRSADSFVNHPFEVHPQRVFFTTQPGFLHFLRDRPYMVTELVVDPVKQHHGETAVDSFRGRLPGGLLGEQWIRHMSEDGLEFWEFDIDDGSPVDIAGLVAHIWQVFRGSHLGLKTDPFKIADRLRKGGLGV